MSLDDGKTNATNKTGSKSNTTSGAVHTAGSRSSTSSNAVAAAPAPVPTEPPKGNSITVKNHVPSAVFPKMQVRLIFSSTSGSSFA